MNTDILSIISGFLGSIPFWGWILIAVFIFFCFAAIMGTRDAKKIGKRVGKIIKTMDAKYNSFIETKMSNKIIQSNSVAMNKEELLASAILVLKPDIESLISIINSTNYGEVEVKYTSQFFNNIVTLCQALFAQSRKNESKTLSAEEEEKLYSNIKDSILADLTTRTEELEKV
ncbi:MAG: hypothetical protein JXJ04_06865 [Spirochaetales bacterium]|nr:hypothetical protein [Spirochaetales bacterium]